MNTISIHSDDILSDHELATIQGGFIPAVIAGVATWKIATAAVSSVGLVFAAGASSQPSIGKNDEKKTHIPYHHDIYLTFF